MLFFMHREKTMEILAKFCFVADTRGDRSDVSSLLVEHSSERLVKVLLLSPGYGIDRHCEERGGASRRHHTMRFEVFVCSGIFC